MARKPAGLLTAAKPKPEKAPPAAELNGRVGSREGKKMVACWLEIAVANELKFLSIRKGTTVQELLERGVDLVFREEGMPQIASGRRGVAA